MTATLIEFVTSPGKHDTVCKLLAGEIGGAAVQTSMRDVYTGICLQEQRVVVLMVRWPSLAEAEAFEREAWPRVMRVLEPFLDTPPRLRTFCTHATSSEKRPPATAPPLHSGRSIQVA